jgi:Fic-DOC domain mobile mystery protein B
MFEYEPDGATPVDADEAVYLIPKHIRTRDELNVWEQENILLAAAWSLNVRRTVIDEAHVRGLHKRMFDKTWTWAGRYRTSDKNLGVPWSQIPTEVKKLIDDGRFWLEKKVYSQDEIAIRLHHRLVFIHPFSNGNGRHARLWSDVILRQLGRRPFSWRNAELDQTSDARSAYITALRAADKNDYGPLFALILSGRE